MTKTKTELAWHFAPDNGRTRYSYEPIAVGEWLEAEGALELCRNGMHASKRLIDALKYAPGALCCRVEMDGVVVHGYDKLVGRRRRVVQMVDTTHILHEFSCRCAEDALSLVGDPDPRSLAAIKAKRAWLRGEIYDSELDAARAAVWDAARTAARDTARDAAWAAARATAWATARDDVWTAARAAAWDAARTATRTATRTAAWDAAWDATRDAAWTAARATQSRRLTSMISYAMREL